MLMSLTSWILTTFLILDPMYFRSKWCHGSQLQKITLFFTIELFLVPFLGGPIFFTISLLDDVGGVLIATGHNPVGYVGLGVTIARFFSPIQDGQKNCTITLAWIYNSMSWWLMADVTAAIVDHNYPVVSINYVDNWLVDNCSIVDGLICNKPTCWHRCQEIVVNRN